MKKLEKKEWRQPKLIIIGQGHPEENVLSGCKSHANPTGTLATATRTNCNNITGNCGACSPNGGGAS